MRAWAGYDARAQNVSENPNFPITRHMGPKKQTPAQIVNAQLAHGDTDEFDDVEKFFEDSSNVPAAIDSTLDTKQNRSSNKAVRTAIQTHAPVDSEV